MKRNELISVIIPTHCRSNKIEKAILSALEQSYDNFEIIVVDDNSDNPEERQKTKAIVNKHKGVRLLQNARNLGGGPTRNVGIRAARGKLISFLDDDDQYTRDRLKKLHALYEKNRNNNIGLVYCSCNAINEKGEVVRSFVNQYDGKPYFQHMLGCIAGTSMWLASKEALEKVGGFDNVPSKQDSTLILKLMLAGYNVYGTREKLVLYLLPGKNNISGTKKSNADGIRKYRTICRAHYDKLTRKEISEVEANFSRQLITIFILNGEDAEAKKELVNIMRYKGPSAYFFKNLAKILFKKRYIRRLTEAEEKAYVPY